MSSCNASRMRQFAPAPGRAISESFSCEVLRSKRKTLALYVKAGKLIVRVPLGASKAEVEDFVHSNRVWIETRLLEESARQQERLVVEHGRRIFYRARELEIVFRQGGKQRIMTDGSQFIIQGHRLTPAKAREQLEDFLIDKASHYIVPRARGLARYLGVEHKISQIKLRKTKSKWGHCTSQGVLQYNWLIMLAPHSIIDYMIAHEVCHLIHMDHSKRFWLLVGSVCPKHEQYIRWLKEHEHRFWF
ncbi:MAG: SprT family zinc-dependent metalloprotease [Gammaproteobacteria bacterium]|nr:SprT family zinc-dependent metalloprotease [Gammaproteobacteria bacterium]